MEKQKYTLYSIDKLLQDGNKDKENLKKCENINKAQFNKFSERNGNRRRRTIFHAYQIDLFEKVFCKNPYPNILVRNQISKCINISEERIEVWFKNRRAKEKRYIKYALKTSIDQSSITNEYSINQYRRHINTLKVFDHDRNIYNPRNYIFDNKHHTEQCE
ncbi:hypothetical protein A3Q56_02011 [Intoshia linei]|uniref:Homeobox domain-containing protein n=1 Tax=Intoshia linei TaxID=1819745 RepID=A0A177B7L7_9BILA|nr:hypothetical protein A3Q56_02011 [Intoshia linei]